MIAAIALFVACSPDQEIHRVSQTDVFQQAPNNEVDILFVVDNSMSMSQEQAEVAAEFDRFIENIEQSDMDFHIGVVTTDMDASDQRGQLQGDPAYLTPASPDYADAFRQRVQVGIDGSDREMGIEAAYQALSEPLISTANAGFRRDGAVLSIIYVSDENDCTYRENASLFTDAADCYDRAEDLVDITVLIDDYRTLSSEGARVLVSSIVGPPPADGGCDKAAPGFRYTTMTEAFGGLDGSICASDFAVIMEDLGLQASGVLDSFQLSNAADEETIEVHIDEELITNDPATGWSYDAENWIVYFAEGAVPSRGSTISITYYVQPGV